VSFIVVSFRADRSATAVDSVDGGVAVDVIDVVDVVERAGFPLQARGGGYLLLHGSTVGKVTTSEKAWEVLRTMREAELLVFILEDVERCIACQVQSSSGRVTVRLNLDGAPEDDVRAAMRWVNTLLDTLPDVEVEASVAVSSLAP
jgi:hypothetical protein